MEFLSQLFLCLCRIISFFHSKKWKLSMRKCICTAFFLDSILDKQFVITCVAILFFHFDRTFLCNDSLSISRDFWEINNLVFGFYILQK